MNKKLLGTCVLAFLVGAGVAVFAMKVIKPRPAIAAPAQVAVGRAEPNPSSNLITISIKDGREGAIAPVVDDTIAWVPENNGTVGASGLVEVTFIGDPSANSPCVGGTFGGPSAVHNNPCKLQATTGAHDPAPSYLYACSDPNGKAACTDPELGPVNPLSPPLLPKVHAAASADPFPPNQKIVVTCDHQGLTALYNDQNHPITQVMFKANQPSAQRARWVNSAGKLKFTRNPSEVCVDGTIDSGCTVKAMSAASNSIFTVHGSVCTGDPQNVITGQYTGTTEKILVQ